MTYRLSDEDREAMAGAIEALGAGWSMLAERPVILCRTCMRSLTWETRTEPGYLPREGWYDDARVDALVCFKAADFRHVPLTDREWAYYRAGAEAAEAKVAAVKALAGEWAEDYPSPLAACNRAPDEWARDLRAALGEARP